MLKMFIHFITDQNDFYRHLLQKHVNIYDGKKRVLAKRAKTADLKAKLFIADAKCANLLRVIE